MSNNSKETMTKKQQDELNSSFNSKVYLVNCIVFIIRILFLDLPWGLPLGFPSLSPFGAFPAFGLPAPNFPSLNSFATSSATAFPPPPSLLSNDSTNPWSNGSSTSNPNPIDYNEYAKQLGFLMNAFTEQETDKSKTKNSIQPSPTTKSSKTKSSHASSASPDVTNGKKHDDSRRSSSSSRSKSSTNHSASTASKTSTTNPDPNSFDPLTFAAAAAAAAAGGGLPFPYFLPSLLSQTPSATGTNTNPSTYPFSSLSSLANPTAGLYPFLSPDWFTTPAALGNLTPGKEKNNAFYLIVYL
jgi:hypothetical protein